MKPSGCPYEQHPCKAHMPGYCRHAPVMCNVDNLPALLTQQQLQNLMLCTKGVFSAVVPCLSLLVYACGYLAVYLLIGQITDNLYCCSQVKHRGKSSDADDFETRSLPLPKGSRRMKKNHPGFGIRSYLQMETTEDDISTPTMVCIHTLSYTSGHVKISAQRLLILLDKGVFTGCFTANATADAWPLIC